MEQGGFGVADIEQGRHPALATRDVFVSAEELPQYVVASVQGQPEALYSQPGPSPAAGAEGDLRVQPVYVASEKHSSSSPEYVLASTHQQHAASLYAQPGPEQGGAHTTMESLTVHDGVTVGASADGVPGLPPIRQGSKVRRNSFLEQLSGSRQHD